MVGVVWMQSRTRWWGALVNGVSYLCTSENNHVTLKVMGVYWTQSRTRRGTLMESVIDSEMQLDAKLWEASTAGEPLEQQMDASGSSNWR